MRRQGSHSHKGRAFEEGPWYAPRSRFTACRPQRELLDEHFTLAGECVPPAILEQASCIGRQWAKEAWLFEQSAEQNLYRLGVERIRWMSPMEERAFARARPL